MSLTITKMNRLSLYNLSAWLQIMKKPPEKDEVSPSHLKSDISSMEPAEKSNGSIQTHITWNYDHSLFTKEEFACAASIPIKIIPPFQNSAKNNLTKRKPHKMPITHFQHMMESEESDLEINENIPVAAGGLKISLGLPKENSFLMNSQMTSLAPSGSTNKNQISAQTQTDSLEHLDQLDEQHKLYEVPVEVELTEETVSMNSHSIQVSDHLLEDLITKFNEQMPKQMPLEILSNKAADKKNKRQFKNFSIKNSYNVHIDSFVSYRAAGHRKELPQSNNLQEQLLLEGNSLQSPVQGEQQLLESSGSLDNTPVKVIKSHQGEGRAFTNERNNKSVKQWSENAIGMMEVKDSCHNAVAEEQIQEMNQKFIHLRMEYQESLEELTELRLENERMRDRLETLTSEQQKKNNFQAQVSELGSLLGLKTSTIEQQSRQIQNMHKVILEKTLQIKQKDSELGRLTAQRNQELKDLDTHLQQTHFHSSKQLSTMKDQIQTLQQELLQKQTQLNDIKNQSVTGIELLETTIQKLRNKAKEDDDRYEVLNEEMLRATSSLHEITHQNEALKQENKYLHIKVQELKDKNEAEYLQEKGAKTQRPQKSEHSSLEEIREDQKGSIDLNLGQGQISLSYSQSSKPQNRIFSSNNGISSMVIQQQRNSQFQKQSSALQKGSALNKFVSNVRNSRAQLWPLDPFDYEYIKELERIVLIYQAQLSNQIKNVEQLQQRVYQYLRDALVKEAESELLYSQLCQYENNLNGLMLEKLDAELENQRLKKTILDSQSKLATLGKRLIRLAKNNSTTVSERVRGNHYRAHPDLSSSTSLANDD